MKLRFSALALLGLSAACQTYPFSFQTNERIDARNYQVKVATSSKTDVLFVIDNSGSMGDEQLNLARNMPGLVRALEELTDADGNPVVAAPDQWVYAGAAPNLTNLMTRNTFAGASWDLLTEDCRKAVWDASPEEFGAAYLKGVTPECLNEVDLKEWLRNAPEKKPMYADPDKLEPTDGKYRGMPALGLSEDQIEQLVAYLLERK